MDDLTQKSEQLEIKIKELEEEIKKCTEEKERFLAGWQRERADFQNYKKDELKRLNELMNIALIPLFKDIINWLDELDKMERLLVPKLSDLEMNGIRLIIKNFKDTLKKYEIEEIPVNKGDIFNPSIHEAVETTEGETDNKIIEVLSRGYTLAGRVLLPTKVKVSIKSKI